MQILVHGGRYFTRAGPGLGSSGLGQTRKSEAAPGMSGPGGEADEIGGKADILVEMSVIGGKAEVNFAGRNFGF